MSQTNTIENHRGYKETKLGWIPEDWEVKILGNFIDIQSGNSPSSYKKMKDGISFIKVDDLNNSLKYQQNGKYSISKKNGYIEVGSVIFPKRGAAILNNKVRITTSPLFMDSNMMALTIKSNKIDTEYLYYHLLFRKLFKIADTSTIPQINNKHILPLKFPVPFLLEQKAIANCLSTWDTAITKQTQLIKAKQQQKKALAQQLLTGKKRLKGFSKGWKENRLSNFIEYTPRAVEKPQEAFTKLGIRSHCKGTFHNENFEPKNIAITTLFEVKQHDLIVNITFAWEGAIAIVTEKDNGALVSHRFPTYVFKENISSCIFFEQFIKTKKFRFLLELISPGGAGRNRVMSKKEFIKLKINIPEYEEQTAIAQILTTADKEITLLQQQLIQLKLQKKGVMQQLLTGKKRLKV